MNGVSTGQDCDTFGGVEKEFEADRTVLFETSLDTLVVVLEVVVEAAPAIVTVKEVFRASSPANAATLTMKLLLGCVVVIKPRIDMKQYQVQCKRSKKNEKKAKEESITHTCTG